MEVYGKRSIDELVAKGLAYNAKLFELINKYATSEDKAEIVKRVSAITPYVEQDKSAEENHGNVVFYIYESPDDEIKTKICWAWDKDGKIKSAASLTVCKTKEGGKQFWVETTDALDGIDKAELINFNKEFND